MEYVIEWCAAQAMLGLMLLFRVTALECYQCHYFEGESKGDEKVQQFLDRVYELAGSEVCHNAGTRFTNSPSIIVSCDVPRGDYQPFCKKTHAVITTTFHDKEHKIDAWARGCVIVPKEKPLEIGCTTNMTSYKAELKGDLFKDSELKLDGRTCFCEHNHCNGSNIPRTYPSVWVWCLAVLCITLVRFS